MFFFHTLTNFPFSFAFDQLFFETPTLKVTPLGHIETTRFESEPSEPGTSTEFVFGHLESHRLTFAQVAEVMIKNNQDDTQKTCPAELLAFCFLQNPKHTCKSCKSCKSCKDIFKRWMDGEGKLPQLSPWFRHMIFLKNMKGDRESANVQRITVPEPLFCMSGFFVFILTPCAVIPTRCAPNARDREIHRALAMLLCLHLAWTG